MCSHELHPILAKSEQLGGGGRSAVDGRQSAAVGGGRRSAAVCGLRSAVGCWQSTVGGAYVRRPAVGGRLDGGGPILFGNLSHASLLALVGRPGR